MKSLWDKRSVYGAQETSYGKPADALYRVLTVGDITHSMFQGPAISRNINSPVLGNDLLYHVGIYEEVQFSVELCTANDPSKPPPYDFLLKACGMIRTRESDRWVYTPSSTGAAESASLTVHRGTTYHELIGVLGTFVINAQVQEIPKITFTMQGYVSSRTSAPTNIIDDTTDYAEPKAFGLVSIDDEWASDISLVQDPQPPSKLCSASYQLTMQNTVVDHHLINCRSMRIVDSRPTGQIELAEPHLNDRDLYAIVASHDLVGLHLEHDGVLLTGDAVQLLQPALTELQGVVGLQINTRFI